ncbi:MAG TPA: ferredoxin--NADP reductase [Polyangiaceae bacterium]
MSGWSEGRLLSRRDWAPGLSTLRVEAEIEPFSPGQFVNLSVPGAADEDRRSYSIASPPGAPLEFLVTEVSAGKLTPRLLALAPGDAVLVERKPQGFFTLRWVPPARDLWLIATGTRLGPFLSILRSDELWERFERVVLVHGVRDGAHLAHRPDLDELARARPSLSLVRIVSREAPAGPLLAGRVTTAFDDGSLERAAGVSLDRASSHVMLCGNPQMIEAMIERLATRGMKKHRVRTPGHVTVEKYW